MPQQESTTSKIYPAVLIGGKSEIRLPIYPESVIEAEKRHIVGTFKDAEQAHCKIIIQDCPIQIGDTVTIEYVTRYNSRDGHDKISGLFKQTAKITNIDIKRDFMEYRITGDIQ